MRRLAFVCLPLCALALPAVAFAYTAGAAGDGTLVVQNGNGPAKGAVMTLTIEGTAIGQVSTGSPDQSDTVVIVDANNTGNVAASATPGATLEKVQGPNSDTNVGGTKTKLVGSDFRFRAASGLYKVIIYGSGVSVFAVGTGTVTVQGSPGSSTSDGRYSIDGGDFHSLPSQPSGSLAIPATG
jgi:hypothetical protein